MTKHLIHTGTISLLILTASCSGNKDKFDANGAFEAVETIISAEAGGKILSIGVMEGEKVHAGQVVGTIDSLALCLNRDVLLQNRKAILTSRPDISTQVEALEQQLATAEKDRNRIATLVQGGVASQAQLDDAEARVTTLKAQIDAQKNALNTTSSSITEQGGSVEAQLHQLNDQIRKCTIINPMEGTVLEKYVEAFEMTAPGKPLYKVADLEHIVLRVYATGNQMPALKLGQQVKVFTDDGNEGYKTTTGMVSWISSKAEFTPKTIQTHDERAHLVYAVKVQVVNDGAYKIGMYGAVNFK